MKHLEELFKTKWKPLFKNINQRIVLKDKVTPFPGVYVIAWSEIELNDEILPQEVFYVGMTVAQGGLEKRLNQFKNSVIGMKNKKHSGGKRFFELYVDSTPYVLENKKHFYYSLIDIKCNVNKESRLPNDLRLMGDIAKLEYDVLAYIKEKTSKEPELNKK